MSIEDHREGFEPDVRFLLSVSLLMLQGVALVWLLSHLPLAHFLLSLLVLVGIGVTVRVTEYEHDELARRLWARKQAAISDGDGEEVR